MATDFKPADLNKDGEVSPAERQAYVNAADQDGDKQLSKKERQDYENKKNKRDLLSDEELAAQYNYAFQVFKADPELWELIQKATAEQWTTDKFNAELMGTDWWKNNNEYAREAFARRAIGGADWEATVADARNIVSRRAADLGSQLSEQELARISDLAITGGWNRPDRQYLLDQELSKFIAANEAGGLRGQAGNLQDQLRRIAASNGLQLSQNYFESAARSVAMGTSTNDDWLRDLREQAASLWPSYSDKIRAGADAYDLASGYINIMAQTFEMMPDQISLNDPYIREAMTGVDDKGNPRQLGLFEFQQKLRQDPRWMGTKQAEDQVSNIANDVLRMLGFVGA